MTNYVVPPPIEDKVVSLTKGTDCVFTLRRRDADDNPVDWDVAVWVFVDIDRKNPTKVPAVVTGPLAAVRIESETADLIRDGAAWRVARSTDGTPSLERPLMVGYFERHDGGRHD